MRSFCVNEDANLGATNVSNSVPKKSPATNNAFAVEEDEDEPGGGAQNSESEKEEPKGVLTPSTVFQNEHSRGQWSCASFSHDAQCVVAASGGGAHELHVWARDTGTVIRVAVGAEASKVGISQSPRSAYAIARTRLTFSFSTTRACAKSRRTHTSACSSSWVPTG